MDILLLHFIRGSTSPKRIPTTNATNPPPMDDEAVITSQFLPITVIIVITNNHNCSNDYHDYHCDHHKYR